MKKIYYLFFFILFASIFPTTVLAETQLNVPFILQITNHKWVQPWADACEEASIMMVKYFFAGQNKVSNGETNVALEKLFKIENKYFGFNKDTNAEQTAELINLFLPYEATVHYNPSLEEIKNEIDQHNPVIALVYGKNLKNKYFRNGGPDYHMLVISGYDEEARNFITQDPGFGRGHNFQYSYSLLLNALHDFLPNQETKNGTAVAIFTSSEIITSANTDGDNDGLTKYEEINFGTSLLNPDTDEDGFTDGLEIINGYSPLVAENRLPNGSIIKIQNENRLYLLKNNSKQYLTNLAALKKYGRNKKIITVSEKFLNNLSEGTDLSH